jgi:hypothetical protein
MPQAVRPLWSAANKIKLLKCWYKLETFYFCPEDQSSFISWTNRRWTLESNALFRSKGHGSHSGWRRSHPGDGHNSTFLHASTCCHFGTGATHQRLFTTAEMYLTSIRDKLSSSLGRKSIIRTRSLPVHLKTAQDLFLPNSLDARTAHLDFNLYNWYSVVKNAPGMP